MSVKIKKVENLKNLKKAIDCIDQSFVEIRKTKFDFGTEEDLQLIFEDIGQLRSVLMQMLIKMNKQKQ